MITVTDQDIVEAVGWRPQRYSVLVVEAKSTDQRNLWFTTDYRIAKHLSMFGPVYLSGSETEPAYGNLSNWRLEIDRRYDAEVVYNYIWELVEGLNEVLNERIEKGGNIVPTDGV